MKRGNQDGRFSGMRITIDGSGRVVLPKSLRDRLNLRGGESLEVAESDGVIEIRRAPQDDELVEVDGILTFRKGLNLAPSDVRDALESVRDRR